MNGYSDDAFAQVEALANHFERMPRVVAEVGRRGGITVEAEAMQIATALTDIRESTEKIFQQIIPKLLNVSPASEEAENLFHEIGEEYRHVLYHIMDTKIFRHLFPELEDSGEG